MDKKEKQVRTLIDMIKHNEELTWEQAEEMIDLVSKAFPDIVIIDINVKS